MAETETKPSPETNPEQGGPRMTIVQHLDELRKRLVRASIAIALVFGLTWFYIDDVMKFLLDPHYRAVEAVERDGNRRQGVDILKQISKDSSDSQVQKALGEFQDLLDENDFTPAMEPVKKKFPEPGVQAAFQEAQKRYNERKPVEIDRRPIVTSYTESIATYMKAALVISLLVAGPYVLWEIWGFIAAGLYLKEKNFVRRYFPLAVVLFFSGVAFGYFFLIPVGLQFLASFGSDLVRAEFRISEYFSLFLTLTFALGLVFQIPMVMIILSRLGIVAPGAYRSKWRYVLVGCFLVSAIITPTFDPYNQSLLAVSMYLLYELGILLAKLAHRDRQKSLGELKT